MDAQNKIPTYIIHLPSSTDRRDYMDNLLKNISILDYEFVDAVYGKTLSEKEIDDRFNLQKSVRKYGRHLNRGEVGCALSHRACYDRLLKSNNNFVLIFEDDVTIIRDLEEALNEDVTKLLSQNLPIIIFLSGDYWHVNKKSVTRVFDAVGGYAYLINRKAAEIISQSGKPFTVADDWDYVKHLGVKLYAVYPYAVDANLEGLPSSIAQEHWGYFRNKIALKYRLRGIRNGVIKLLLAKANLFESKRR